MANRYIQDFKRLVGNDQIVMSTVAVIVGGAAAGGAIAFREAIDWLQYLFLGFRTEMVVTYAAEMGGWRLVLAPVIGGLLVGLFCKYLMPGGRPQGVANVIESSALRGGRMSIRQGLGAAVISATSIGCGASVGREGPAVHLGASLASFLGRQLNLTRSQARTLLGCGVASAVAASFNAPIAGVFFALEGVIGHYALSAFAPIVIASVFGTILSRIWFGDYPAFEMPSYTITSFLEFPAFMFLGVVCAVGAIALMRVTAEIEVRGLQSRIPRWIQPAGAGLIVGVVALEFPEILGVGYEAMDTALHEGYGLQMLISLAVLKILLTAICLGAGFGGGIFSPSLFIGAMIGGAYGIVATIPFPELSSGHGAYTLIAMGAVSAATLGAPISTILIIFELTGDYKLTVGVMVAVVIASVLTRVLHSPSFFADQLRRRGVHIHGGHDVGALRALKVHDLMQQDHIAVSEDTGLDSLRNRLRLAPMNELFVVDAEEKLVGTITLSDLGEVAFDSSKDRDYTAIDLARKHPPFLEIGDGVEKAIRRFSEAEEGLLAVVDSAERMRLIGCLHERAVMRAYNQALIKQQAEEHGETL